MSKPAGPVTNVDDAEEHESLDGEYWGGSYKLLTPFMSENEGALHLNVSRTPPGRVGCPFHYHLVDDEVFYVLSGTGLLRYGEDLIPLRAGDCISCPAGTEVAHQIANTGPEDLVYLGIGRNSRTDICVYPDSNKINVRALKKVGYLEKVDYMDGEPERPKILDLAETLDT